MTTTTPTVDLGTVEPFDRTTAIEIGRIEYRRFVDALRRLESSDWSKSTDCDGWTVRDLVGHLAGSMKTQTSLRNVIGEQRAVKRRVKTTGEGEVDAMTALQVESMSDLEPMKLIETMSELTDRAANGRKRPPSLMCRVVKFPVDLGKINETWTLGYLVGTILTRDTWLHRVADLARAVEHEPQLDHEHDGRIVADVAAEWARRHGKPFELELTGPAGGRYVHGATGAATPRLEIDAVEFCRVVSERSEPTHPLLETPVPF